MSDTLTTKPEARLVTDALRHRDDLRETCRSVVLGTVNTRGHPDASYSPAVVDSDFVIAIYVSELARHTENLRTGGRASVLLIEDESKSQQLYARRRLTIEAKPEFLERAAPAFDNWLTRLESRHGAVVSHLRKMSDFHLVLLHPREATLVYGFGRAFRLSGPGLSEVAHLNVKGHRPDE